MLRLSEEQRIILNCYSGTKEEVIEGMKRAVPFIEDIELREMTEDLLYSMEIMQEEEFAELGNKSVKYD